MAILISSLSVRSTLPKTRFIFSALSCRMFWMNAAKCIFVSMLIFSFLGCKVGRAGTKESFDLKTVSTAKESETQNLPQKKYGGLYSDSDLDTILKQNDAIYSRDAVAYYYAGNRCADGEEYQEAAKLYAMAAETFQCSPYKYGKVGWDDKWEESYPCTLDENGECEEFYFSIYNLSCCMSLLGFLELSEAYLYNAIIAGYPYLKHLLSDSDLENLYNSENGDAVKERAKKLFARGNDADFFAGKEMTAAGDALYFHFNSNGKDAFYYGDRNFSESYSDEPWCMHGTYVAKNFHVLIQFDSVLKKEGRGNRLWGGGVIDRYDAYTLPTLKERNKQYVLSPVELFKSRYLDYAWKKSPAEKDLIHGSFLESVLDKDAEAFDCCFLRVSCIDFLEQIFEEVEDIEWHPEDYEKNREQNRLEEERRKQQAQTALIGLSKEEIAANAERRLERYREFAEPIIRGYKEKGKIVALDSSEFSDSEEAASLSQETEFCYVAIKGTLKSSGAFENIYKTAEECFSAGCFLDFSECESGGIECDFSPRARIKGIIFPKNLMKISVSLNDAELEIMEFQDCEKPVEIDFGYYKDYKNKFLKALRLPEGLKTITEFAFMNCCALMQVYAPKSLETIEHHAFYDSFIPTFEIPENVRTVQEYVFDDVTEKYIPAYRHHPENYDWYYSWISPDGYSTYYWYSEYNVHWGSRIE